MDDSHTTPTQPVTVRQPSTQSAEAEGNLRYPPPRIEPHGVPTSQISKNIQTPWLLLITGLGILLIVAAGLATFTWLITTRNLAGSLGNLGNNRPDQNPAGAGVNTPKPTGANSNFVPSPWPTLTPTPANLAKRTATLNPTQNSLANRLLSSNCKNSLDQLSKVSDQIKTDPTKLLDDSWRKAVDQATADLKTNCGSLESASPIPGELGSVQTTLNQANSEFDQAKQLWDQVVEQRDPGKVISAASHLSEGAKYLGQAMSELQAILSK